VFQRSLEAMEDRSSSDMAERLKYLLKYQHLIIVPYHPKGNSMAERRMKEVGAHLRALVYEYRIKSEWFHYLPLVQRILNYTVDGSIGT
jgi:UDP-N-acetylglucosamine 2-epimerase